MALSSASSLSSSFGRFDVWVFPALDGAYDGALLALLALDIYDAATEILSSFISNTIKIIQKLYMKIYYYFKLLIYIWN